MLGRYRIESLVGRGGMGAVYLATDTQLDRRVALKVLSPELSDDERFRNRFIAESRIAASLDHPNIVPVYEAGEIDGRLFIAMRYIDGHDLSDVLAKRGALPVALAVRIIASIAAALDAAHAKGLVHRDVKPGNVLLAGTDEAPHVYLTDFGLTKRIGDQSMTAAGQIVGSIGYVAPEQVEGRPVDQRTDVYSLGCLAFELLAGTPPFRRDSEMATLMAHVQDPPPSLLAQRPELPEALDAAVAQAMAKDPAARFASAGEFSGAVTEAVRPDSAAITRGFLFADLRDYTSFVETRGDDAAAALLGRYRALVRAVIGEFGGAEIRTEGDSFYVVFPSASSAVLGGLAVLAAAAEATRTDPSQPLRVGIGVHAGETAETGEGPVGSAVNIAARVCAQARAGELLVTDTVRSLTRTRLTVRFTPRGNPSLKGIREPISLFAVQAAAESVQADPEAAGRGRAARMWSRIRARPAARWVMPGVAAAVVIIAVLAANALLGSPKGSSPSGSGTASGSRAPTAITSLPPMADVPFYRADDHRSSIYPGPGPVAEPQVAWQVQLGGAANFVPIVVDGKVIVGDLSGILRALDARTGREIWRFQTEKGAGFAESAAAADGLVFVADLGGTLYGLDAATGNKRWDKPLPNSGVQPIVADGLLYVGSSDGHAYGFDPATGQPRWDWEGPAGTQMGVSVVSDGVAYIGGGGVLYAIRLVDRAYAWPPVKTNTKDQSTAVLAGDTIFWAARPGQGEVTGGELLAIDRATGKVRWRWSSPSGQPVNPASIRDGIVYVVTTDDGVYALRDKGTAAEQIWHFPGRGNGRPTSLVDDTLYLQRVEGPLIALAVTDGHQLWQTPPGTAGTTNPVVTGGMIFQVDAELNVIRGWAEPALIALLPSPPVAPSASPAATQPPDPFAVVASFPWSQTGIQVPAAMDLGADGRLYVLHAPQDASNPLVTIIDPKTGRPISGGTWGRQGSGEGEFSLHGEGDNGPGGCIAVGPDRLVYVGDFGNGRVEVFKSDGTFVRQIGSQGDGPGQLSRIIACDVGLDGSVYTLDHDLYYLSKFDATGKFIWRMLADPVHPGDLSFQLHGFTIRPDGKIVGCTDGTGQVLTIDPADGRIIGSWGTPGNEPGQLSGSGEPSVDNAGNLYVFQYVSQAVQVFDPQGRLIGGIYQEAGTPDDGSQGYQFLGRVFWPPPVFDKDGFGYTFGPDGLVKLKVSLPPS